MSTEVIERLKALNRKERFYLVGFALDKQDFTLGERFRSLLQRCVGDAVPPEAFAAMDYHLSWLYAAAVLSTEGGSGPFPAGGGIDLGNQEDVDLLVAYRHDGITRLLILEAKGVTSWSNRQLTSKVSRLRAIFGEGEGNAFPAIRPEFAIVSPVKPGPMKTADWPDWMKRDAGQPFWIHMPTPTSLLKVTRCDEDKRTTSRGGYWKVEPDRVSTHLGRLSGSESRLTL